MEKKKTVTSTDESKNARVPFFFRKTLRLDAEERAYCTACAESALHELKRLKSKRPLNSDQEFNLVGGLASYVVFLRHVAAGHEVRYTAIFHIAANIAAYLGHERVMAIIERNGVFLDRLEWFWLNPLASAIIGHRDDLAEQLLERFPHLVSRPYWHDCVARCVKYGTVNMLRILADHGVALDRVYLSGRERGEPVHQLGSPFYFAVACQRRDMQRELIRLGAVGDLTVGAPETWFWGKGRNVFEVAIKTENYTVADICIRNGAVPDFSDEYGAYVLNRTGASKDLKKFKWLSKHFPLVDFAKIIRTCIEHGGSANWFCGEVLEECGLGGLSAPKMDFPSLRYAPDEVPEWIGGFFSTLEKWPELIIPWCRKKPHLVRLMFAARGLNNFDEFAASLVPVFRFAKLNGLELWGHWEQHLEFMELLDWEERRHLAPHVREFGFPNARLIRDYEDPKHPSWVGDEWDARQARAAKARGRQARRYMDDEGFHVGKRVSLVLNFANALSEYADWELFQQWMLRGIDVYSEFGLAADYPMMRCVNAKLLEHLIVDLGMLPHPKGRDGAYAMHCAIRRHDIDMVRTLLKCGVPVNVRSRDYASPLREAILFGADEIADLLFSLGGRNRDEEGRLFPIPPWVGQVDTTK